MGISLAERQRRSPLLKLWSFLARESSDERQSIVVAGRQLTQADIDHLPKDHARPYRNLGLVGQAVRRG